MEITAVAREDRVTVLSAQYVELRQTGKNKEQAWAGVAGEINALTQPDRNRLASLLHIWEAERGCADQSAPHDDPFETPHQPPEGLEEMYEIAEVAGPSVIRRIKPISPLPVIQAAAQPAQGIECPSCHKPNAEGETCCHSCGTPLIVPKPIVTDGNTQKLAASDREDSYFGNNTVLYLRMRGTDEMLRVRPGAGETIIGRKSPDSVMVPDLDLTPYEADVKGVSRLHAAVRRHGQTLVITDMGSLNHTYVNGQRLHLHEVRVLHNGDVVRFGQLSVQVYFRPE